MLKQKPQLGKGMAALLGGNGPVSESETHAPSGYFERGDKVSRAIQPPAAVPVTDTHQPMLVDIEKIFPHKNQPRKIFKEKELTELSESIKENGLIQPIVVTELEGGRFELVAGERRLRASKLAGLERIPVLVKRLTKKDHALMSIIENVQRADLNCVEEALAYFQLMNEFGLTQEEVAKKIGKERSTIANFLRILKLPKEVILYLNKEQLHFGHAKLLVALSDEEQLRRLANEVVVNQLSVRELEELIKKSKKKNIEEEEEDPSAEKRTDRYSQLRDKLQKKTGFHFDLKASAAGVGSVIIKFNNEAEFNDVYNYLMK